MAQCDRHTSCAFFNDPMSSKDARGELLKTHFCQAHWGGCARYFVTVSRGNEAVPADLLPNHIDRAKFIVRGEV